MSDVCDICCDDHNTESIILKCNHKFHYFCIVKTFIISDNRKCPYCRIESDLIEYNKKYGEKNYKIHY